MGLIAATTATSPGASDSSRREFVAEPRVAALRPGLELSEDEMKSLLLVPGPALARFAACVHDRICRLAEPAPERER